MVGAGNICEFHVAAVKKLAPDVELVGVDRPRSANARAANAEKWGTTAFDVARRAGRRRRERDPRADAAVVARAGRARRARARLPRADREADRRGRGRGARDRRAREAEGPRRDASTTRCSTIRRSSARSTRCAPARSARSCRSTSCAAREYPPYEGGPLPPWYRDAGYPFRDIGVHCLYLIQELLGPIEDVDADWRSLGGDPNLAFDEWRALVRCKRGLGQFQLTWNTKPMQSQMIIHGTKGVLRVDLFAMFHGKRASTPLPKAAERLVNAFADSIQPLIDVPIGVWKFVRKEVQAYQGLRDLVADFYRRLAAGEPPPVVGRRRGAGRALGREGRARRRRRSRRAARERSRVARRVPFLVTGASGSLGTRGRQAAARRRPAGARVRAPDPRAAAATASSTRSATSAIRSRSIARSRAPRRVIHVGAAMKGGWPEHQGGTVVGTQNVIDACKKHGVKQLVHISSMSVIDWAGSAGNGPVSEARRSSRAPTSAARTRARSSRPSSWSSTRPPRRAAVRDPAPRPDLRRRHPADQRRGRAHAPAAAGSCSATASSSCRSSTSTTSSTRS